ncbi:hypothetical protein ELE36_03460 [Pseudolysobacter antarcticus]|uniref:Uncharacterized protein n=1 Tax=Pseudolysobacter antarcticus TaxID=2511995 RepID=A0A411HGE5_9GAMM|nr:hypothetical protein [Pseudolysobacter antarcticus]QBB69510.1 hypothetical protein ELE36_03460 [Pseudolysobacter antarcticus]
MNEFEWQRQLRTLAQPREPQNDLWANIAAGISAQQQSARRVSPMRWAWAAVAILCVGLGSVFVAQQYMTQNDPSNIAGVAAPTTSAMPIAATASSDGSDHLAPRLSRTALDWASPSERHLSGAARELDSATAELQQAMEMRPDAVFLVGLLNRTNAQRMRLTRLSATAG